jgi:muramoyltetrapeptide carboxypeptidase
LISVVDKPVAMAKPARLSPGGRVGVIAPAGCVDERDLASGVQVIRQYGFDVELAPSILERRGYLAGDERARANDLVSFFERIDISAIFCARGGFGSAQLLPYLTHVDFSAAPKIFAGYSDITMLLNWFNQRFGLVTFHAPMVAMEMARGLNSRSQEGFWSLLMGKNKEWRVELGEIIRPGIAEGAMMGGCLSVLVTSLGTPYEIETNGKLLFLEDVGERPYRVERMLTHLKMAGKLDHLAGLVFGDFINCEGDGSREVRQIVGEMFAHASYPVVMGLPAGHGPDNITLPFGVRTLLDGVSGTLALIESPVL